MPRQSAKEKLQTAVRRFKNFMGFTGAYLRKNNPVKKFISGLNSLITEIITFKKKLKKIEYRINYEKYKLKKTELILAQNSEHMFLRGRSLDSTR